MQLLEFEKPVAELERELEKVRSKAASQNIDMSAEIETMEGKIADTRRSIYENLTPWQRVQIARHTNRPFMLDYVSLAFTGFSELHGDRHIGDDLSMPGGFARIGGRRVVVLGHQKGRDTKENLKRNFGSAHPEGYRKALRLMKLAEKFGLPVITLIDTPGAFPGIGAEETEHRRSHRLQPEGNDAAQGADHRRGPRRRRLRRCPWHRRGRPRPDDGECLVLGHQPGRLRRHSLEASEARP